MRPNKLIMSAFGPYAGRVEVDLEKLGERGIYLITGDTGAGKTTIFDAITYALFGEASGANRDSSMFRSKYAEPETPTEVELYFSYGGKDYYVKRNPEYIRPKSKSEGFTTEKANAELHYPDGRVVTKLREVNSAVIEIMGIDRNQFTQIAMIAQGDFLKLLLAPTDERKKIFQKLFKTQNYYVLQEKLKYESGKLGNEVDSIKKSIEQYINGIMCDEDDVLYIQVKKAKENQLQISEIIELLEELIKNDKGREEKSDKQIRELDSKLEEITKILTQTKTLKTAKEALEKARIELEAANASKDILAEKLKAEESKKGEIDEIAKKIGAIDSEFSDYDELDNKKKELSDINTSIKDAEEAFDFKNREQQRLTDKISKLETELKGLENVGVDKAKLEAKTGELLAKATALEKLSKDIEELKDLEESFKSAQEIYREKSELSTDIKAKYEALNKAYLDEQAGILAQSLAHGQPCPVCGSTAHPHIAKKSTEAPTKQELENAKLEADKAQQEEIATSRNAGQLKAVVTERKAVVDKLSKELLKGEELDFVKAEISSQLSDISEKLAVIERDENRRDEIKTDLPVEKEKLESFKKDISLLNENITKNKATVDAVTERIGELGKKLMFESKAKANEAKYGLELKKAELENALKKAADAFAENERNITAINSRIEENKRLLANSSIFDIAGEEEKQRELKEQKEKILNLQKTVHSRKTANILSLENIVHKSDEIKTVEEKWTWVKNLSNTANGNLSGKEKVMLETYIQMNYFDRIINRANTRFMIMSGGQYELKRRVEAANNRSQSGLELDVIDHYNGTERSVKTLSGGESFKASLSLALGLSDEIQSSAGGIKLDTMFVDEGFGSLDDESLSQAINALSSLAEGNRLVGIISHVNELKERIDKQIVVKKEKTGGSNVSVVS